MHLRRLVIVVLLLAGCARFEPRVMVESDRTRAQAARATAAHRAAPKSAHADYVVVRGDTLYGIAFRNKLDFRDLAAWNNINAPHTIYPGQGLRLTPPSPTTRVVAVAPRSRPSAPPRTTSLQAIVTPSSSPVTTEPHPATSPVTRTETIETFAIRDEGAAPTSDVALVPQPLQPVSEPMAVATVVVPPALVTPAPPETVSSATAAVVEFMPRAVVDPRAPTRERDGVRWRWPVSGRVIGRFVEGDPTQQGIDVGGQLAQAVLAASDGEVVYSGNGLLGYGELVIVQHAPGFLSAYGHNQKRLVAEGATVKAGQPIAEMGRRGGIDMLHFEIRKNGKPVDPLAYLPVR